MIWQFLQELERGEKPEEPLMIWPNAIYAWEYRIWLIWWYNTQPAGQNSQSNKSQLDLEKYMFFFCQSNSVYYDILWYNPPGSLDRKVTFVKKRIVKFCTNGWNQKQLQLFKILLGPKNICVYIYIYIYISTLQEWKIALISQFLTIFSVIVFSMVWT